VTDDAPQLRGELRELSSPRTETVRVAGVVGASLLTIVAFVSLFALEALSTLFLLGVSAVFWLRAWVGLRLSVVETDGYWLLASSMSKTAWISLSEVISVSRVWWPGAQRIYVEVGQDTPFGREIVFEAPLGFDSVVGGHPVVEELRKLVARAKARCAASTTHAEPRS
jgi:hypothetical protein